MEGKGSEARLIDELDGCGTDAEHRRAAGSNLRSTSAPPTQHQPMREVIARKQRTHPVLS